jgi:hypothetical protein
MKTGGPAFPYGTTYVGMTLRDYFAAKAMQGLFARDRNRKLIVSADENAKIAYEYANAMLKAREQ